MGGASTPTQDIYGRMWGHTIIPTVAEGLARFDNGWEALQICMVRDLYANRFGMTRQR